jgi:hypothetical protein
MREKLFLAVLFLILAASTWLWEYSKFSNGHGMFYYFSPDYGAYLLTISMLILLGSILKSVFSNKDKDDEPPDR